MIFNYSMLGLLLAMVGALVARAIRRDRRRPRYRLDELTDLSRLDIDDLIQRDRHGHGRQ